MDGTKGTEKLLAPTFVKVGKAIVKCHFHCFIMALTESFDHVAKRLVAVGKTLADSADHRSVRVAEIFAENIEIIISIAHDEFHLVTHVLIVVFGYNIFNETYSFLYFFDHRSLEVKHGEELLKHTREFASFTAFALFELTTEFCCNSNEVENVATV